MNKVQLDKEYFLEISAEMNGEIIRRVFIGRVGIMPDWLQEWIITYQRGENPSLPLPLDYSSLTAFQEKILRALQTVPFGKTVTYKELAAMAGHPRAVRATASVCAMNPWPLVVPCHRVIRTDGGLGGFAFGLTLKKALLDFEGQKKHFM